MRKMTRAHSLVRQLVACETVGSTTVICSDKTGTMTQNKMQVDRLSWGDRTIDRGSPEWSAALARSASKGEPPQQPMDWIALIAAVGPLPRESEDAGDAGAGASDIRLPDAGYDGG